mmetsp:Transcript_39042/g.103198  ORF Transcript_39042/g.103198 Transcript_39042/m.103198 type:complete len:109 (-) Transcript_39042:36-362(-)
MGRRLKKATRRVRSSHTRHPPSHTVILREADERRTATRVRSSLAGLQEAVAGSPSWETSHADPELWTLILQLSDMGFGEDYDALREALERNNMDLGAAAVELSTSRRV